MLEHHDIDVFRRAAALAHAVPEATLTVTIAEDTVLTVTHALDPVEGRTTCTPCGFRTAVARAWRAHLGGRRLALLGLDGRGCTAVHLDVGPGGDVLDGDLVVARIADRVVGVLATTLAPAQAAEILTDAGVDTTQLASHHDEKLGTTLLHLTVPIEDETRSAAAVELLGRARDACSVGELLVGIAPATVR